MESWIIYYDLNYDAVPWPFGKTWDDFVRSPEQLVHACDDFGRAAPCDSLSETPSVPPHLPRLVPRGRYRFALYHDADWLYAFLEAEDGPVIVASSVLAHIPQLQGVNSLYPVLALLTPDQRFTYRFALDAGGKPTATVAPVVYGKRQTAPPKREFSWELKVIPTEKGRLCCWRIARASIADAFLGNTVRLSISHMRFETMEAVAWGSHTTWGPRPDEFGTLRLVEKREQPLWPRLRRAVMRYDPATERATFHTNWEGIYDKSETDVKVYPVRPPEVPWLQWSLRLNGEQRMFDLRESAETDEFALADGHNHLDFANTGGPAVRISVEKRSGNRISESPFPPKPARSRDWLIAQIRGEVDAATKILKQDAASGAARIYRGWGTYQASSLGRIHHYLDPDPRLLEALRIEADFALTLQRPDGTFAGLHLERTGQKRAPWKGGAYDTGPAGELWVVAAWLLKDEKYLEASKRLVHAYKDYRVEFNYNYAAFALYHLVTHYRLTRDPLALEHALYYCQHCVAVDLLPLGFHAGHNYYTCYGSITLRGMAQLCAVLPESDPYRATLREQCIRMTNQVLARQQPDGSFDGCNRFFLDQRFWSWGLFSVAFLLLPDDVRRLDAAIQLFLHCPLPSSGVGGQTCRLAESDLVRYYAHREDLLAGRKIDPWALI
jgi:hypothetical protein